MLRLQNLTNFYFYFEYAFGILYADSNLSTFKILQDQHQSQAFVPIG
jgi:hypothetical protein